MPEQRDLTGEVIAITGASSGIGAASARILAARGARLVLGARREARLSQLVDELGADVATAVAVDVRRPEDSRRLVRAAVDRFGRLDALVASAGVGRYGGILDGSDDELAELVETNISGTVWVVRAAVEQFDAGGRGGDIVIVSSAAALKGGGANEAVYAATKFAQLGFAGAVDREVRERGIRVTTICPAGTNTEFALGRGRVAGEPRLDTFLLPEDVGAAITAVLEQPRRVRTTLWALWSMEQGS